MSNSRNLRCSFCGKGKDKVSKFISGPSVYICNECVAVCAEILTEDGTSMPIPATSLKLLGLNPIGKKDLRLIDEKFDSENFLRTLLKKKMTAEELVETIGGRLCGLLNFALLKRIAETEHAIAAIEGEYGKLDSLKATLSDLQTKREFVQKP